MDVRIPSHIGVSKIEVMRTRAEVTDITLGYYAKNLPIIDGGVAGPPQDSKFHEYKMHDPKAFAGRNQDFYVIVNGTWRWGGTSGQGLAKIEVGYTPKYVDVVLYTGSSEPGNTVVRLTFTKDITAKELPTQVPLLSAAPA